MKIGDLGLATLKSGSFAKSVIGTPEFMAPEMYEERYDEAVDVYAFGMCMLEMATSEYPYNECTVPAAIYKKVVSGVKPASFDKVLDDKVRQIIARCIQLNKDDRPSCKELLNSEFFSADIGLQLQPVSREAFLDDSQCQRIEFRLKLLDSKRRAHKHREDEAIQFHFECNVDQPDVVAREMCDANIVSEEDAQTVAKLLHVQITSMLKERRERQAAVAAASSTLAVTSPNPAVSTTTVGSTVTTVTTPPTGRPSVASQPIQVPVIPAAMHHAFHAASFQQLRCNGLLLPETSPPDLSPPLLPLTPSSRRLISPTRLERSAPTQDTQHLSPVCCDSSGTPTKTKRPSRCQDNMVPKLQVMQVDGRTVECSMECMQKTITFKFDMDDVNPDEVASRLVI